MPEEWKVLEIKDEVLTTCRALFAPHQVAELRVLEIPGTKGYKFNAAGWFNDFAALATTATDYSRRNPGGIYVTINPLHAACLARATNRVIERQKETSADRDVLGRHWLLIDLDAVRPVKGISASDAELVLVRQTAVALAGFLENTLKFPPGLRAFSGNGIHLLYRVNLPNDDASRDLIKACLAALDAKFTNEHVIVDRSVYNAARIMKLWGTITRKGEHTSERPHRQSRLWTPREFSSIEIITPEQLAELAELAGWAGNKPTTPAAAKQKKAGVRTAAPEKETKTRKGRKGVTPDEYQFDLDAWIQRHGIHVARSEPWDGTGVRHILAHCLFDESHVRTSAVLGRAPTGAIFYKCQHESCADKGWKEAKALFDHDASATPDEALAKQELAESPWALATAFIQEEYTNDDLGRVTLRRHRETFYSYKPSTWSYQAMTTDKMRVQITRWLGENGYKSTSRAVNDVLNAVASAVTVPEEIEMPFRSPIDPETGCAQADPVERNWVTLRNGILDIDAAIAGKPLAECLMNHTAEWFSTTVLPFNFPVTDLEATCDRWLEFLNQVLEGDAERIAVIQDMFGYCFWRGTELESFFILYGRGRNGKSTVLEVLQKLLGSENVSNLSLDQIADPIMAVDLYQKAANICSDLPPIERVSEGLLNRITSGEPITVRRLYKGALRFRPRCKLIFSTNILPRFVDTSLGVWRRMVVVPFNWVVPDTNIDTRLRSKLEAELPGILVWALEGAARLAAKRAFSQSQVCAAAHREYRLSCFPIFTFLEECVQEGGRVGAKTLWITYRDWCHDCGLQKPKPLHPFIKDVLAFYPSVRVPRVRFQLAAEIELHGISLRDGIAFGDDDGHRAPPLPTYRQEEFAR